MMRIDKNIIFVFGKLENLQFSENYGKPGIFQISENGKLKKNQFSKKYGKLKDFQNSEFGKLENFQMLKMHGKPAFKKGFPFPFQKPRFSSAGFPHDFWRSEK